MTTWEYLILELPSFEAATHAPGASAAVHALNAEGEAGLGGGWGFLPGRRQNRRAPQETTGVVGRRSRPRLPD